MEPEKQRARETLKNHIRAGSIKEEPCAICGETKTEGHHVDYSDPLNVIWLCKKHHELIHHENKYNYKIKSKEIDNISSTKTNSQKQSERQEVLNKIARLIKYKSWRKLETAVSRLTNPTALPCNGTV